MSLIDNLRNLKADRASPAENAFSVTPHDTNDLQEVTKAVLIGVAGNLAVIMKQGDAAITLPVPAGYNPLRVSRVLVTNTTATGIVGLV
jgi:hypothetical protein